MLMKFKGNAAIVKIDDLINTHGLFLSAHNGKIEIGERTPSGQPPMYYLRLEVHKDAQGNQVVWCPVDANNGAYSILLSRKVPVTYAPVETNGDLITVHWIPVPPIGTV